MVAPSSPPRATAAGKHFKIWPWAAPLDQFVLFVGLAAVLALPRLDHVDLAAARRLGAGVPPAGAEQDQLGDVAEVEADAAPIRAAILADFVPDEVGFVLESPSFHNPQPLRQKGIWNPHIQMGRLGRAAGDGQGTNVRELHRRVAAESVVLRRDLPCAVLKLPGGVGEDSSEFAALRGDLQANARLSSYGA